jgi:hypothetical protein
MRAMRLGENDPPLSIWRRLGSAEYDNEEMQTSGQRNDFIMSLSPTLPRDV